MGSSEISVRRAALWRMAAASAAVLVTFVIGGAGVVAVYYPLRHAGFGIDWLLVFALMTGESAGIHLPSEVILPVGGWLLVRDHHLGLMGALGLACVGGAANTLGSGLLYVAGNRGGRPLVRRYGRYFLVHESDIDAAEARMRRRPGRMLFVSRLLPVVRTYGGFVAGLLRVPAGEFAVATFLGSFVWCLAFIVLGWVLGNQWSLLRLPIEVTGITIGALLLAGLALLTAAQVRRLARS
jgi:membrane protein DedA with SNARE-associated domain